VGGSALIKLADALAGIGYLGFDTAPIIYFIEVHPKYDALVTEVFRRIDDAKLLGCTSVITVTETCNKPAQQGNMRLVRAYHNLLVSRFLFWKTVPIRITDAARAADLRAKYNIKTPDALQLAVAIDEGCEAFLTNDVQLKRVTELRVLVLDELEL